MVELIALERRTPPYHCVTLVIWSYYNKARACIPRKSQGNLLQARYHDWALHESFLISRSSVVLWTSAKRSSDPWGIWLSGEREKCNYYQGNERQNQMQGADDIFSSQRYSDGCSLNCAAFWGMRHHFQDMKTMNHPIPVVDLRPQPPAPTPIPCQHPQEVPTLKWIRGPYNQHPE